MIRLNDSAFSHIGISRQRDPLLRHSTSYAYAKRTTENGGHLVKLPAVFYTQ